MLRSVALSLLALVAAVKTVAAPSVLDTGALMPVGAYYYPEHWPREQWDRDLARMAELGFSFTHMGEFAWAQFEPREGEFDFAWHDLCVAEAARRGLGVWLCPPSPCPPAWLTTKHPEILNVDASGIRSAHGGNRLHANQRHPAYRAHITRIVEALARRYGQDERVWGWQVDNEPHLGTLYDYSAFAQEDFRVWLRERYTSDIAALNAAWGTAFWSGTYNDFEQIRIPNEREGSNNPHALLDFRRYTADALAESVRFQARLLRGIVVPRQWITTNYAYYRFLPSVDLFRNRGDLDFAAHTMYLLSTHLDYPEGPLGFRLGSGLELAFSAEMARSIQGETGIMELQPGQINWGSYNAQPLPGAVRMWIWHCFGLGDRFVCTYRFRQPLFGGEQTHKGILETDGVTVARGGAEFVRAIGELRDLEKQVEPGAKEPAALRSRRAALLWKQDTLWEMQASPHTKAWDTWRHVYAYYAALKSVGAPVTFVAPDEFVDPAVHPFLIVPACSMVDDALVGRWRAYAEAGGHLVLSVRTGQKDDHGHFHETRLQAPIRDLIGAAVEDNDQLPPGIFGAVRTDEAEHRWNVWGELLAPEPGTEILARYQDQYYAGTPAVVTRRLGRGSVTYLGAWSDGGTLEREVIRKTWRAAGATVLDLPPYVFVEWRAGVWVAVNYSSEPVDLPLPTGARLVMGQARLAPGEVTLWRDAP